MGNIDLLLENGHIVTSAGVTQGGIGIRDGKVAGIYLDGCLPDSKEVIDVKGNHILPGIVDPESHLGIHRSLKDDLISETKAALAGGVTTWGFLLESQHITREYKKDKDHGDMKLYSEVFPLLQELAEEHSMVDFFFTPIIMNDEQAEEIPSLAEKFGITSYKLFLHAKKADYDEGTVYLCFEKVSELGPAGLLSIHCENAEINRIFEKRLKEAGRKDMGSWDDRSPHFSEAGHVREYTYYAKVTGCPVYIQHVTTRETIHEIARARFEGTKVIGQSGPHYLSLPKDVYKVNVPLRDRKTMEVLWQGLGNGYIDCLGSDHVNHGVPREAMEVKGDVWKTISGFSSRVEAFLPIMLTEGVAKGRISLERLVEVCCENPAKAFGLYPRKGTIMVGSDADLLVVDLDRPYKLSSKKVLTSSGWTIFDGRDVQGLLLRSFAKGQQVLRWSEEGQRHEIVGKPQGKYLPRNPASKPFPIAWSCPFGLL